MVKPTSYTRQSGVRFPLGAHLVTIFLLFDIIKINYQLIIFYMIFLNTLYSSYFSYNMLVIVFAVCALLIALNSFKKPILMTF